MKIASKFDRPDAPIELNGRTYYFRRDPSDPNGPPTAEVEDPADIQRLLSITEGYYIPGDAPVASKPAPRKDPNAEGPGAPPPPEGSTTTTTTTTSTTTSSADGGEGGGAPAEAQAQADEMLALSWQALQARISKGDFSRDAIELALKIEEAKPDDDQRASTIKQLKKGLEA
jgi:hypothetical protein